LVNIIEDYSGKAEIVPNHNFSNLSKGQIAMAYTVTTIIDEADPVRVSLVEIIKAAANSRLEDRNE